MSRTVILGLLAVMQIAITGFVFYYFSTLAPAAYLFVTILSVLCLVMVFEHDNINPAYKLMWALLVLLMPVSGAIYYLAWGNRQASPKKARILEKIEQRVQEAVVHTPAATTAFEKKHPTLTPCARYLATNANAPLYADTQSRYFAFGEDFFAAFLEEIRKAKRYIFMEYFIIEEGLMWNTTLEILRQKAAEGVDVRVLYDAFGCLTTLPQDYDAMLRGMGIKCHVFNPMQLSTHITDYKMLNHRDHRKISIIDGETAFTGGLNFADEYINKVERFGVWKDTAFSLKGSGVYPMTVSFLKMWDFVNLSASPYKNYLPRGRFLSDGFVQPYTDSPLDEENVAENTYFHVIQSAQKYVYVTTPYLILDHEMVTSLRLAAKSGVDVRIITPGIPDKWYAYYVTQSFYPILLEAGVRIYEYTPGFLHAKMYVSDDRIAIVGSANMDYRSLYLHFENCCVFYGGHMVKDVKKDIDITLAECHEVTLNDTALVPWWKRLVQVFLRFFAPMM